MAYRLNLDETVANGIKRIATEQADRALQQVSGDTDDDLHERIHDTRKRLKKIRAVLRLVRDEIGSDEYSYENACYRDIGRRLAPLRERRVALQTLDHIQERYAEELQANTFDAVRTQLVDQCEAARQTFGDAGTFAEVAQTLRLARTRISRWPIEQDGFTALRDGLKRVYKRGYKGIARAIDSPTPENLHEWRKRVKYLWYHTRILENMWPDVLDEFGDATHDLADYLGDANDLTDLCHTILGNAVQLESTEQRQMLVGLLDRWHAERIAPAFPLGRRIYTEKPKVYVRRMQGYWDAAQVVYEP